MAHILKNDNIKILIDLPKENYNFSRFDWTGKIVEVYFQGIQFSSAEKNNNKNEHIYGKGFYNEFGISTALGYDETEIGDWFHKIGVGLLKKDDTTYQFHKKYEIKPAEFNFSSESNKVIISCNSEDINGYSYFLKKEIELHENGFTINYYLLNTGQKDIVTDEYVHNFTAINKQSIGNNYTLNFPFQLTESTEEFVNPEQKIYIGQNNIDFKGTINKEFFIGNLTAGKNVDAQWKLINHKSKIGLSESGNFQTNKVNLWGAQHVVSPELFIKINIKAGKSAEWSRTFSINKLS